MKKAVITFIFGKGKELLREPKIIDEDVEYICVTDQKDLKSKNWKIVIDLMSEVKVVRDKMVYVKYNPFKYTNAEQICVIDGALEIKTSLKDFFNELDNNEIALKNHPKRKWLDIELNEWCKVRNLDRNYINKFDYIAKQNNLSLNKINVYETCVIGYNNNTACRNLCENVISYMKFLGQNGNLLMTNQCVVSLLMKINPLKCSIINQLKYFNRYRHNTHQMTNW